jgi:hypothetical protein
MTLRLALNVMTLIHFYVFCNDGKEVGDFSQILVSSLKAIRSCNASIPTRHIARLCLSSLVSKLQSSIRYFPSNADSPMWTNLLVLLALMRKFVFFTPKWEDALSIVLEDDHIEGKDSSSIAGDVSPSKSQRSSILSRPRTSSSSSARRHSSHGVDLLPLAAAFAVQQEDSNFMDLAEENPSIHRDSKGFPDDKMLISKTVKFLRMFKISDGDNISSVPVVSNYSHHKLLNLS